MTRTTNGKAEVQKTYNQLDTLQDSSVSGMSFQTSLYSV